MINITGSLILPCDITDMLTVLSRIPFENLSKAINVSISSGNMEPVMDNPHELLLKHKLDGTGGTCFSLTWFLLNNLKKAGHSVYPVLCDRFYGSNTHCCAILDLCNNKYLLDPGYLAFRPILLSPEKETIIETVYNTIEIIPCGKNRYKLFTKYLSERKERFTIKDEAVSEIEFLAAWKETFLLESLRYPVITAISGDAHLYFQKERLYIRRKNGSENHRIDKTNQPELFNKLFGIKPAVTKAALELFR